MTIQNLNSLWHKNTLRDSSKNSQRQDSQDSVMQEDYIEDEDSSREDPGPSPFFMFLPQKILQIKMILKAAFTDDPEH